MNSIFMECELSQLKAESQLSATLNRAIIEYAANFPMVRDGYFSEAEALQMAQQNKHGVIEAIEVFFKALKDSFKKLIFKVKNAIAVNIDKRNLKNKINEMKKIQKISQSISKGGASYGPNNGVYNTGIITFYVFNYPKYLEFLDKYLGTTEDIVHEIEKKSAKMNDAKFNTYIDKIKREINDASDFYSEEKKRYYYVEMPVGDAIVLAERLLNNYKDILNKIEKRQDAIYNRIELAMSVLSAKRANATKGVATTVASHMNRNVNTFANNVVNCVKPGKKSKKK